MGRFCVERTDLETASNAWTASSQALVATEPRFLEGLCGRVEWWVGTFRGNPIFYWPVCLDHSGNVMVPALPKYVGPFATEAFTTKPIHRQWSIQGYLFPEFLSAFSERYGQVAFSTQPGQIDVRQFAWWSEQSGQSLPLNIQPRYTAMIRGLDKLTDADLLCEFRRDRKVRLSRLQKSFLEPDRNVKEQEVFELYQAFMKSKGQKKLASERSRQILHIARYARESNGEIIAYRDTSNTLVGVLLLLYSRNLAHSVMAIASEEHRSQGILNLLRFSAIKLAREAGKTAFDFVGANSPIGASEKHSYGATPELYFRIESR